MGSSLHRVVGVVGCALLALCASYSASGAAAGPVGGDTAVALAPKPAPARVKAISAGFEHSLALLADNTVVA